MALAFNAMSGGQSSLCFRDFLAVIRHAKSAGILYDAHLMELTDDAVASAGHHGVPA
jgi:hypothetical protein